MTTNRSGNRTINKDQMQTKAFTADVTKKINETKRTIDFVISNETPDRHGDIILLKGWDTKAFMENPVVLFAHSKSVPPIAKALKVWKSGGNLNATAQFMDKELSPFADSIFNMFKEGFLKAVSVGFMPKEFELIQDDEGFIDGFKFIKQELLEFSAVPIPSNPDALIKARHKGINVEPFGEWAENMLDDWANSGNMIRETYNIGKKQIELIRRKAIGETMSTYQVPEDVQIELLEKNLKSIAEQAKAKEEKEKEPDKKEIELGFKLNRSAVAYANSLIEKDQVNMDHVIEDDGSLELDITKEHLAIGENKISCHIITSDCLFRSAVVQAKQDSAYDGNIEVFNAASRLLKKLDGENTHKTNEYEDWDKDLPTKDIADKTYESLDVMQHTDDGVASVFYNNSPQELIIQEDLFKSSGGHIGFTGNSDNLSIVLSGSNTDLNYYPHAKDGVGGLVCTLDSNQTAIPYVIPVNDDFGFGSANTTFEVEMRIAEGSEEAAKKELQDASTGIAGGSLETSAIKELEDKEKYYDADIKDIVKEVLAESANPITPMELVQDLEGILIDIEEVLEKDSDLMSTKNGDKRFIRKIKFVAQYMKDLAIAISPVTTETTTTVEEGTIPVIFENKEDEVTKELTEKDIDDYLVNNLGPTLDKIVKDNLNKMQGRLD